MERRGEPGHAKRVGRLIAENTLLKRITIVDEDIDIQDQTDIDWVMSSHYDPQRDTEIIRDIPMPMDHSVSPDAQGRKLGGKIIIMGESLEDDEVVTLLRRLPMNHIISDAHESVSGSEPIEIQRIYVDPSVIGQGLGAILMQACLDEAEAHEYETIWLGVWEHNHRAIAFYEKWGFDTVGKQLFQLGSDEQTDVIMQRAVRRG